MRYINLRPIYLLTYLLTYLLPNQQRQSTEGEKSHIPWIYLRGGLSSHLTRNGLKLSETRTAKVTHSLELEHNSDFPTWPRRSFFGFHRLCQINSNCPSKQFGFILNNYNSHVLSVCTLYICSSAEK